MRARYVLVLSAAAVATLALSSAARAGGVAEFNFDRHYYVPGDLARGEAIFEASLTQSGRVDGTPFFAYLIPQSGGSIDPPRIPAGARPLGRIQILDRFLARLAFWVPDVPPGVYAVSLCNRPCRTSMVGDLWGGSVTVVGSREQVRLAVLADRLKERVSAVESRLASRIDRLRERVVQRSAEVEEAMAILRDRLALLQARLAEVREAQRDATPTTGIALAGLAATLVLAGVTAIATRRKRRSLPGPLTAPGAKLSKVPLLRDGSTHPDFEGSPRQKQPRTGRAPIGIS